MTVIMSRAGTAAAVLVIEIAMSNSKIGKRGKDTGRFLAWSKKPFSFSTT
jgi:hypothetical protein